MMLSSTSSQCLYQKSKPFCKLMHLPFFKSVPSQMCSQERGEHLSSFCSGVDCTKAAMFGLVRGRQLNSGCVSCLVVEVLIIWSCGMKTLKFAEAWGSIAGVKDI